MSGLFVLFISGLFFFVNAVLLSYIYCKLTRDTTYLEVSLQFIFKFLSCLFWPSLIFLVILVSL